MKLSQLLLTVILATGLLVGEAGAQDKKLVVSDLVSSNQGFKKALQAEVSKAKRKGLKPIVLFYSNACQPSMALIGSLEEPLMKEAFDGSYIVKANLDTWGGEPQGAGFSIDATPTLFRLSNEVHPLGKITGEAWGANIPVNMAPPLKEFVRNN